MTPLDKLYHPIAVGDVIAYGHALGRCAALKIGRVMSIEHVKPTRRAGSPWRIRVQGIDDDMAHYDAVDYPPKLGRPGTLMFPERVIVLNESDLPESMQRILRRAI